MPGGPLGRARLSGPGRGSGQGRGQTGRLGAGGRPLKRPRRLPPPASRLLRPRAPAPRPGVRLHPCQLRPPACARGRLRVTEPGGQSALRAARRQRCHSSRRAPAKGAEPRVRWGGARREERAGRAVHSLKGWSWTKEPEEAEARAREIAKGEVGQDS